MEEAAAVVELPASVEEHGRVARERAEADHVPAAGGVADELPHGAFGARRLAAIGDLLGLRGHLFHGGDGRPHDRANPGWNLPELVRELDPYSGRHQLGF